jgi:hypothetical protein
MCYLKERERKKGVEFVKGIDGALMKIYEVKFVFYTLCSTMASFEVERKFLFFMRSFNVRKINGDLFSHRIASK